MSVPGTDLQGWRWLRGRAGRAEYWLWLTVTFTWIYIVAWAEDPLAQQVLVVALWLGVVRRLHDLGLSGWWIAAFLAVEIALTAVATDRADHAWALALPGFFGLASFVVLGTLPGHKELNRFGDRPGRGRARHAAA